MTRAQPPTPVLDQMLAVRPQSQVIGEFLEWLQAQGIQLMKWEDLSDWVECWSQSCYGGKIYGNPKNPCPDCKGTGYIERKKGAWFPIGKSIESLLVEYFHLDENAMERERRALLDWIQAQQS